MIVARIGWMKYYNGPQIGDEKPQKGGQYGKENVGHEVKNFNVTNGKCYGYFSVPGKLKLSNIDPSVSGDSLEDVLVIFVATHDELGQVIVGWYSHAILYEAEKEKDKEKDWYYMCETDAENAVLLPTSFRTVEFPKKDGIGQRQFTYPLDKTGKPKPWTEVVSKYIQFYAGPNLVSDPSAEDQKDLVENGERLYAGRTGQGYVRDSRERKAIENRAMNEAVKYFESLGFNCEDVHSGESFDLKCVKGTKTLFVEVKGTKTDGNVVFLTRNEVNLVKSGKLDFALFVWHGIRTIKKKGGFSTSGGYMKLIMPWMIQENDLVPMAFEYSIHKF